MTKQETATDTTSPVPPEDQHDARIILHWNEVDAAIARIVKNKNDKWWQENTYVSGLAGTADTTRTLNTKGAGQILGEAIKCINALRCGAPEGTVMVDENGSTARRYWSRRHNRLEWLVTELTNGPDDAVALDSHETAPGTSWVTIHRPDWPWSTDQLDAAVATVVDELKK